jgi:hypothetical protein
MMAVTAAVTLVMTVHPALWPTLLGLAQSAMGPGLLPVGRVLLVLPMVGVRVVGPALVVLGTTLVEHSY